MMEMELVSETWEFINHLTWMFAQEIFIEFKTYTSNLYVLWLCVCMCVCVRALGCWNAKGKSISLINLVLVSVVWWLIMKPVMPFFFSIQSSMCIKLPNECRIWSSVSYFQQSLFCYWISVLKLCPDVTEMSLLFL
jgi:hypothetical protein